MRVVLTNALAEMQGHRGRGLRARDSDLIREGLGSPLVREVDAFPHAGRFTCNVE